MLAEGRKSDGSGLTFGNTKGVAAFAATPFLFERNAVERFRVHGSPLRLAGFGGQARFRVIF